MGWVRHVALCGWLKDISIIDVIFMDHLHSIHVGYAQYVHLCSDNNLSWVESRCIKFIHRLTCALLTLKRTIKKRFNLMDRKVMKGGGAFVGHT